MNVLAGDIGGTKTLLLLAEVRHDRVRVSYEARFENRRHTDFQSILRQFIAAAPRGAAESLQAACVAVAGPVERTVAGAHVHVTNLPWSLDEGSLASWLGIDRVRLINDFEAVGYGTETLTDRDTIMVQAGAARPNANRITLGAGTGLGFCQSVWSGDGYRVIPSEAGHTGFTPADQVQTELLLHLLTRRAYVATEDVLSGSGLKVIFDYLRERGGEPTAELLQRLDADSDPAAVIATFGATLRDPVAANALDVFIRVYGAVAGNLALLNLPYGGVYIAGGIAPKLAEAMTDGRFIAAFRHKGKMSALMARFPVHIVRDEAVGAKGAALVASRLG